MSQIAKKNLIGKVIKKSGLKTINVLVQTYKNHPLYHKRYRYLKKYLVHDEKNLAKVNQKVVFQKTKPISKKKNFTLIKIINQEL